jgi:hypothetical protein
VNEKLAKVMQKIVNLRALAARAGTQAEAETAAAQAEALLAKYQIDEASIVSSDVAESIEQHDPLWTGKLNETWRGSLVAGLSKDHGCAAVAARDGKGITYRIAGRKSDVEIVRYVFAWLTVEIERLAQREKGRAGKTAFRCGVATGVLQAMRAARAEEVKAAPTGTNAAIVLSSRADESMNFLQKSLGGRFKNGSKARVAPDAYARGLSAGAGISNRSALTGGSTRLLGSGR